MCIHVTRTPNILTNAMKKKRKKKVFTLYFNIHKIYSIFVQSELYIEKIEEEELKKRELKNTV